MVTTLRYLSLRSAIALAALVLVAAKLSAENVYFPHITSGMQDVTGVFDISKPPYNIAPNTGTDVTAALQQVLDDHKETVTIYMPNGTYLVSNTLTLQTCINYCDGVRGSRGPYIQGQSEDGTVIRLVDGTWPNGDEEKPVIHTGDGVAQVFDRGIFNLTVNTGSNNAGAFGIYWYSNNLGLMSDVSIISEDGRGLVGLHLGYPSEQGPTMCQKLYIRGFQKGIYADGLLNAVTLQRISLEGQSQYGVELTYNHPLWIDGLTSVNTVPAVWVHGNAKMVLVDADLTGGSGSQPAIKVDGGGKLFARNVTTSGYQRAISSSGTSVAAPSGTTVGEYSSHGSAGLFTAPSTSMNLPVVYPPEPAWETDTTKWANASMYKGGLGMPQRSDAQALQAAIDDGSKTTVMVSRMFALDDTVRLRGNISRLIGSPSWINGVIAVENGSAPVVKIMRLSGVEIVNKSNRSVICESIGGENIYGRGTGDLFITDFTGFYYSQNAAQRTFAWHYDAEWSDRINLEVQAGTVRMFGWKTESYGEKIHVTGGGVLELLGFHVYSGSPQKTYPLITVSNSSLCVAGISQVNFVGTPYYRLVQETRNGVTRELTSSENPNGDEVPLFLGYEEGCCEMVAADDRRVVVPVDGMNIRHVFSDSRGVGVVYSIAGVGPAALEVLDARGRVVGGMSDFVTAGIHEAVVPMHAQADGAYFVRLRSGSSAQTRSVILVR